MGSWEGSPQRALRQALRQAQESLRTGTEGTEGERFFGDGGDWEGEVGVMGSWGWDGGRGLSESGFAGLEDWG